MKNKFLFSLLFLFLLSGFLFFKADFAFGAEGMCTCEIYSTDTGDLITAMDDVSDESPEVCSALDGTEPFENQLYKNCLWLDTGGVCGCTLVGNLSGEVKYVEEKANTEEECTKFIGDKTDDDISIDGETTEGYSYEDCEWKGASALQPITTEESGLSLDLPSVSGLNQLKSTDVKVILGTIIKVGMGLIGSIALALFAYSGVLWMVARGNAEQGKKARDIMIWAVLGLFVILASYTIVSFIFSAVE